MEREEAERKIAEFNYRLNELAKKNPQLQPDSPEVKALIKEFNDAGIPIQIIKKEDIKNAMMGFAEMLSQMGLTLPPQDFHNSGVPQSIEENIDPCKFHKKGLDTIDRKDEISKVEVDNFSIDINTMTDEQIFNKYFKNK